MVSFCIDHVSGSSRHWWPVLVRYLLNGRREQIIVLSIKICNFYYMLYAIQNHFFYSGFFPITTTPIYMYALFVNINLFFINKVLFGTYKTVVYLPGIHVEQAIILFLDRKVCTYLLLFARDIVDMLSFAVYMRVYLV